MSAWLTSPQELSSSSTQIAGYGSRPWISGNRVQRCALGATWRVGDGTGLRERRSRKQTRGNKSSYTDKQKRQADHIEEGYESRGVEPKEAERRAWATVNKETHGGKQSGSGRGTEEDHAPARKGGRLRTASVLSSGMASRTAAPSIVAPIAHSNPESKGSATERLETGNDFRNIGSLRYLLAWPDQFSRLCQSHPAAKVVRRY
jgi:hypothetical protein